jgi:hypothetical protein
MEGFTLQADIYKTDRYREFRFDTAELDADHMREVVGGTWKDGWMSWLVKKPRGT